MVRISNLKYLFEATRELEAEDKRIIREVLEHFNDDKQTAIKIIDAMIAKQRMTAALTPVDAQQ